MAVYKKTVNKPISLAGCLQVFEKAGVPESTYRQWDIHKIFEEAEKIALNKGVSCEEVFIDINK